MVAALPPAFTAFPRCFKFLTRSVYQRLRHFLFLFPGLEFHCFRLLAFVIWSALGILGASIVWQAPLFCFSHSLKLSLDLVNLHPYEYAYYNELVQIKPAGHTLLTDYWGLSYLQ